MMVLVGIAFFSSRQTKYIVLVTWYSVIFIMSLRRDFVLSMALAMPCLILSYTSLEFQAGPSFPSTVSFKHEYPV